MKKIQDILKERGETHGDFSDNAAYSQQLKRVVESSKNWESLTDVQRESMHMILHKISRICAGNANERDHYDDIAGYAKLAADRIEGV